MPTAHQSPTPSPAPELLKIILLCLLAAITYGILHDLFTAHIYPPYFNVFHPDLGLPSIFHSQNPNILALAWGIAATWSVGILLGVPRFCPADS